MFVVGQKPGAKKSLRRRTRRLAGSVAEINGRVFRYQESVHKAREQYSDYIEKNKNLTRVSEVPTHCQADPGRRERSS